LKTKELKEGTMKAVNSEHAKLKAERAIDELTSLLAEMASR